jgi:hypothetical protein
MTQLASSALASIPDALRDPLLEEFNKLSRNYREGRWEPAELNGGKFCEIVYCILSGHLTQVWPVGPSKPTNMVDSCKALEAFTSFPRSLRIQIPRILMGLYEIRNNRNVGHVGGDVDPNHMDAAIVFSMCRWIMAELVRVFHNVSVDDASEFVDGLTDKVLPIIWKVDGLTKVLDSSLRASDKVLLILYSENSSVLASDLMRSIEYKNSTQFMKSVLTSLHKANLVHVSSANGEVTLSPLGVKRVEDELL